ncbi:hypothetical protein AQJ91_05950 [Streptomyces dysideae]|uniref:Uncharacterized protein n=1 Tax=Streptomyces dysideae TaxID=909626 RepID=A0A101V442_9ACTN|nr:hypothetical protein AQJ91_05950 [Streptomyces dysideae]
MVAVQQFWSPSHELCHLPVARVFQSMRELLITGSGYGLRHTDGGGIESIGYGDQSAGQQFPHLGVIALLPGLVERVDGSIFRPQGAQDEDRRPRRFREQRAQRGGDAFAKSGWCAEVVLGFVQPDDRVWRYAIQVGEGGLRMGGVERMPKSPPQRNEGLDRFPAGAGLPC